jgi:hypothetical protein
VVSAKEIVKAIGIYKHHLQILVNDPFPGVHHQQILQIKLWQAFGYETASKFCSLVLHIVPYGSMF